jgi:hypothetical protein
MNSRFLFPVLGTLKEPLAGWIDNVYTSGFGFIAGAAKGVFRVVVADQNKVTDLVPCDHVANLMVAAAWRAGVSRYDATKRSQRFYAYNNVNIV